MPDPILRLNLPSNVPTAYADFVNVWHTRDIFVLDFLALDAPPSQGTNEDGEQQIVQPANVVQRVRIPPAQMFELMKALESQLSAWEQAQGHRPS